MKKFYFIFFLFLILSGLSFSGAKFYSLVAPNPTCGNQVTVEVWVDNADNLLAIQWRLNFDDTAFSYSSWAAGPILAGWLTAVNPQPTYVNFAAAAALPIPPGSGAQMLASFTFDTLTTVCDGATPVFQLRLVLWSTTTEQDVSGNDYDLTVTVSCPANPPISIPSNPFPADGATNQPTTLTLNWDDSTGANTYDLYFGTTSPPLYYGTTAVSQYNVAGLADNTQYFWYVVADNTGNTCPPQTGTMWTFTTTCVPPAAFNNLAPANGAIDQPINGLLIDWEDSTGATSYDLYFGTTSPPPLFQSDLPTSSYTANGLSYNTQYFWYVVAKNTCGTITGAEWSFTTIAPSVVDLVYDSSTLTDTCFTGGIGDANGVIDPGESIYLTVTLANNGTGGATNVQATLSTITPGVTITTNSAAYPDIPASGTGASLTPYIFDVDYTIACGSTIDFTLNITADQGTWTDSFQLTIGSIAPILLAENFDSVVPPNLPANWTSVVVYNPGGTTPAWATNAGTHHPAGQPSNSPPNLVWFNSWHTSSGKTARLQYGVSFNFTSYTSLTFSFWMYHDTGYSTLNDRVQVQVSTDGGTSWTDVGSPISRYDGTTGWAQHTVDLSAYISQTNVMIGVLGISEFGNDCHLDDLMLYGTTPSPHCDVCMPPMPDLSIQSTSFTDDCISGGPGDANSIAEPGENLSISPIIQNTGLANARGVQATLSTANPLVSILVNTASYGNIPSGGTAPPSAPFQVYLDPTIPCFSTIDFNLDITSNEGSWTDTFQINVGGSGAVTTLLSEDFESWPPAGWTIVDEQPGWSCDVWQSTAFWGASNDTGGAGEAADADADACGAGMHTSLISPPIDLTSYSSATLEYKCNFQDFAGNGDALTHISTDGGATWTILRYETNDDPVAGHTVRIDLTPYVGNTIQIRFLFYTPGWDWYWMVDEVRIQASTAICNICTCPLPDAFNLITPPNASTGVSTTNVLFDWQDSTGATSYNFYLGTTSPPPLYQAGIAVSQFTVPSLMQSATYFWYVQAVNSCGTTPSSVWSFTTEAGCIPPEKPQLISPPNGSTGLVPPVEFTWSGSNADYYEFYLGTAPNQLQLLGTTTSTSYTVSNLEEGITYWWLVNAINSCANASSAKWSFTTEGPPPAENYTTLIPVVASAQGARSSNWVTDLQIFNPTDKTINFSLYFIPPDTDGTKTPYVYTSTVEPKKLKIFKDIVSQVFQLSEMSGALQIVPDGKLIATARVYNQTENGTFGQFVKGYNLKDAVAFEGTKYILRQSEVGHIIHLTNSILFRTNIGFVEVLGRNVTVNLSIYDDFNNLLGSSSYNLLPMGFLQVNDVFGSLGISGLYQAARAEITVEGEGAVFGYGSIIDNNSNDAIFVPTLKEIGNLKEQSIGVAVHKEGDKGTYWRSDLRVFNLSEEEQEVTFNFMEKGQTFTKTFTIQKRGIMNANDALQQIFELNDNYGNMEITAPNGILTTSRIYTTLGKQTYGQFVPSTISHNPIRLYEFQYLLHLSQNESFRTNVGLSEVSGNSATVEITIYDNNGNELGSGTYNLSGYELKRINRIFELFNAGEVENGYAKVSIISGEGSVLVYASVVDNLTGDAIYVIGQ